MKNTSTIEWELARTEAFCSMYQQITSEQLRKLQNTYLEMMIAFEQLCQEHNLKAFMVAGTLIGALRHKGFIPWDDDMDFVMYRKDYEKLKQIVVNHPDFELISPTCNTGDIHRMLKIKSKHITYFDVLGAGFSQTKYLYLDMLPIDYVPENLIWRKIKGYLFKVLDLSYASARCYTKYTPHLTYMSKANKELRQNLWLRRLIGFPARAIGPHRVFRLLERILLSEKPSDYITIAYGVKGYFGEMLPYAVFGEGKRIPFEQVTFIAPDHSENYLTNRYGDFMTVPNKNEQFERLVRLRDDWKNNLGGV